MRWLRDSHTEPEEEVVDAEDVAITKIIIPTAECNKEMPENASNAEPSLNTLQARLRANQTLWY